MARLSALMLTLAATTASAHEFWIQPSPFTVAPNQLITVTLHHGERFAGDIVPRDNRMLDRFEFLSLSDANMRTPVVGMHAMDHSYLRPTTAGPGVIVYQTTEYLNTLPADRFEAYLHEEGLGYISDLRAAANETDLPGREAYIRCAKSLISIADDSADSADSTDSSDSAAAATPTDTIVGLDCEIILESIDRRSTEREPHTATVTIQILFLGEPLANTRVVAVAESDHEHLIELTTDDTGHAALTTSTPGPWMFTTLHMTRATNHPSADFKSYWASLTFSLTTE